MVEILDCTLREAPVEKMVFGKRFIQRFLSGLGRVGVDVIECGFLKNEEYVEGSTIFKRVEEIQPYLLNRRPESMYVALVDYGRYDLDNLSEYTGESIDGIRICFKKAERNEVIEYAKAIKKKGYKVFIQHVDTLDYTDLELLQFIAKVNELRPYAYSVVDTFGSMYVDDMRRICELVNHNLDKRIKLGFHGHDNLMMANANVQEFVDLFSERRDIIVDASLLGCGRGAGNAKMELVVAYLNKKRRCNYDLNEVLDMIDHLMPRIQSRCTWGYSMPYVLSGLHGTHVFNVNYLLKNHNIKLKDLRGIIERLDYQQKKKYDYDLLDSLYVDYFDHSIDDKAAREYLKGFQKRKVLILAPGKSLVDCRNTILDFIEKESPMIISLNSIMEGYTSDFVFFSSCNRYEYYENITGKCKRQKCLVTSNIKKTADENEFIFDYRSLLKYGWRNMDSSVILLFRLLLNNGYKRIYFAGLDGFRENKEDNYFDEELVTNMQREDLGLLTKEICEMFTDMLPDVQKKGVEVKFVTESRYEDIFLREGV